MHHIRRFLHGNFSPKLYIALRWNYFNIFSRLLEIKYSDFVNITIETEWIILTIQPLRPDATNKNSHLIQRDYLSSMKIFRRILLHAIWQQHKIRYNFRHLLIYQCIRYSISMLFEQHYIFILFQLIWFKNFLRFLAFCGCNSFLCNLYDWKCIWIYCWKWEFHFFQFKLHFIEYKNTIISIRILRILETRIIHCINFKQSVFVWE